MCLALDNREENQLSAASYNLINKQGVRDGSMGYNKKTRFSEKLFLNQYLSILHLYMYFSKHRLLMWLEDRV